MIDKDDEVLDELVIGLRQAGFEVSHPWPAKTWTAQKGARTIVVRPGYRGTDVLAFHDGGPGLGVNQLSVQTVRELYEVKPALAWALGVK